MKKTIPTLLSLILLLNNFYAYSMLTTATTTEEEIVIEDYYDENSSEERSQLNITHLPDDCIGYALEFLSTKNLLAIRAVNKDFYRNINQVLNTQRDIQIYASSEPLLETLIFSPDIAFKESASIKNLRKTAKYLKEIVHEHIEQNSLFSLKSTRDEEIKINFIAANQRKNSITITHIIAQNILNAISKKIRLELCNRLSNSLTALTLFICTITAGILVFVFFYLD